MADKMAGFLQALKLIEIGDLNKFRNITSFSVSIFQIEVFFEPKLC